MSGDVQPRKRNKDKQRTKKKGSFESQRSFDEKDALRQKISWCSFGMLQFHSTAVVLLVDNYLKKIDLN
ncbi:hypothetical protein M8J76_003792 [Diaphorina citri]|nr:hypothetical protein M8J76_003792 [Diaphorina citri]